MSLERAMRSPPLRSVFGSQVIRQTYWQVDPGAAVLPSLDLPAVSREPRHEPVVRVAELDPQCNLLGHQMTPQERTELEQAQRSRLQEINVEPGSRQDAESRHGQVWDSEELRRDFEVLAFCAPWTVGNWDRAMNAYKPKARAVEEQIDLALGY